VKLVFYDRRVAFLGSLIIQPPFNISVRRYSWDVYGGPKEMEAIIDFPSNKASFDYLWSIIQYLRCPVELYDYRGAAVWWGFLDKITVNDGVRSFGIAIDNMFNRVKATYELLTVGDATGLRADTTWYEDTISSGIYGVKEKVYSMTSYSIAAAEADAQTRLEAAKYPGAIAELAAVANRDVTIELLFSGWWKILNWIYYSETDVTYSTIAEQLVTMAELSEFTNSATCEPAATTLVPDFRQGDELLLDEILKLMEAGTDNGRRILAKIDENRKILFTEEPERFASTWTQEIFILDSKNQLYNSMGGLIEPTECKVGVWAWLKNYEMVNGFGAITSPSPVFIERATYDVEAGEYQPESFGYKSPFDELQSIQR
jgi:hypothetical protein